MTDIPDVGAQDPELKNSPIALESDEVPDEPFCYFNSEAFPNGAVVKSGPMKLRCDLGIWVPIG
jgi:hypothetical protein